MSAVVEAVMIPLSAKPLRGGGNFLERGYV